MAHQPRQLRRYNSIVLSGNRKIHFFNYASDHTRAEIVTAGYFNESRSALSVGSVIDLAIDVDGAISSGRLRVTAVPASGNVTVADVTGVAAG